MKNKLTVIKKSITDEYNKAVADGELTQDEVNEILQSNGISYLMMDNELDKQKKKAERLLKNKESTQKVLSKAKWLCDMLCNLPFLGKLFDEVAIFCELIMDYCQGLYSRIPLATVISLLAAIIYFVSPADMLPDTLPVIGLLDDATILQIVKMAAKKDIENYNSWKASFCEVKAA